MNHFLANLNSLHKNERKLNRVISNQQLLTQTFERTEIQRVRKNKSCRILFDLKSVKISTRQSTITKNYFKTSKLDQVVDEN